ncbi:Sugar phosphate isomerase/epimerase [Arenibacter palladensis]|uniref:Sugar phosphate isomerase/epimerase n=1 Tax=Arenibacter palladensis TaxID=237373 RepID=A0A1M5ALU2_9FLAO|nr:sugar phosphate isomerase/epimerase [Arenibacter palladensis]SHF31219.1 Sugar phosphate isomerase/epimerase [Arenibacter palladensis]
MNRRNFIGRTAVLSAATLLPMSSFSLLGQSKYKMGYQLFSVRTDMAKDPLATIKALKEMGYEDFEFYGFDADKGLIYGYTPSELKHILDDLQLSITSGHYSFSPYLEKSEDELKHYVNQYIIAARALDSKYITWPYIAPEQRTLDNFKLMSYKLNLIGQQVNEAGLGFAYHNHGYEFEDYGGQTGFDIIINETDAKLVKLQMDMYWVMHSSKQTPKELIEKQPGRYVMWHIKDMDKISRDYSELGNGSIDYHSILPDPKASGLEYYYLEQGGNFTNSPMKSAADSAEYCKKHLRQYL